MTVSPAAPAIALTSLVQIQHPVIDVLVAVLANVDRVKLESLPRMADFARWVTAAEPALGWEKGTFMRVYGENRDAAHEQREGGHATRSEPLNSPLGRARRLRASAGSWLSLPGFDDEQVVKTDIPADTSGLFRPLPSQTGERSEEVDDDARHRGEHDRRAVAAARQAGIKG